MPKDPSKASHLLLLALDRIAYLENKSKQALFDEIGYAMGRNGGSAIQYWVYHQHVPAKLEDVQNLAQIIAGRKGWEDDTALRAFLEYCDHPTPDFTCQQIVQAQTVEGADGIFKREKAQLTKTPFVVGPPIHIPRRFFGRERELRRIFASLRGPLLQHSAVIGVQRSGKTSLLHYIRNINTESDPTHLRPGQKKNWLEHPEAYRWLFIDFQDPRVCTREGFMTYFLRQLNFPVPNPCELVQFVDTVCRYLTRPAVILLDEIQIALANPDFTQQFWWGLRSLAGNLTEGRLGFVIASHGDFNAYLSDASKPSPFLNIFGHQVRLGPLDEPSALELISASPLPFPQEDIDWIMQQSGRWPALMQILCSARLVSLEEGSLDNAWRQDSLEMIKPYLYLLEGA